MSIASSLSFALFSGLTLAAAEPKRVSLFVLAGESNAVGYGADPSELPAHLRAPMPGVPFWFVEGPQSSIEDPSLRIDSGGAFQPLAVQRDPSGGTFGPLPFGFGSELSLGRTLADALGEPVAIVKFAFDGASLNVAWNPHDPTSLYPELIDQVFAAIATLEAQGFDVDLGGFCWMQGESDALAPLPAWLYEWNLHELIASVRADLGAPALPFAIGLLNQFIDGEEKNAFPYLYVVRDAQIAVDAGVAGTSLIDTDGFSLGADGVHFDAQGQIALGEHFARAILCGDCSFQSQR